jgi:hypothetical protein
MAGCEHVSVWNQWCQCRQIRTGISVLSRSVLVVISTLAMTAARWRFQRLSKQFEALVRDLNDSQDAGQRREYLRRMSVILNQVDELILKQYPRQDSERNSPALPPDA